jgi:predicted aspartyl protease
MKRQARLVFVILMLVCPSAKAAFAECAQLRIINTIKLESTSDGERLFVPITLNGSAAKLILDTGGAITQLSPAIVKTLNLRTEPSDLTMFDAYGHGSALQVVIKSFGLGNAMGNGFTIHLSAMPAFDHDAVGLLSTDLFANYDIDLDFGANRLNYFSKDHCEGRVAYWRERPLSIIPFTLEDGHINLTATVDGHDVSAIIDTGAPRTIMTDTMASEVFGLVPGPDMSPIDEPTGDSSIKYYAHKFAAFSIQGLVVNNPNITIMTDRMGAGPGMEKSTIRGAINDPYNHIRLDRLVIGMNVLKRLHVYIAYGEKKLYISPAGTESALFSSKASGMTR